MPAALFGFLVMSFADGIGVATSRLNAAFGFPPAVMGVLPSLVFLWFFVLSLLVGGLCARCGRKRVAFVSLLLTALALVLPMGAAGVLVLPRMRPSALALPCVAAVVVGIAAICLAPPVVLFFAALVLVSFGSANFYGIAFGLLAERHPDDLDRLSSLLVMSISSASLVAPVLTLCGWRF